MAKRYHLNGGIEMKKFKSAALALAAVLTLASAAGCNRQTVSGNNTTVSDGRANVQDSPAETTPIGENKHDSSIGTPVTANDTTFTINSVISPDNMEEEGKKYIYFDVTIKNDSAADYSLSTLNNFYITMNDGTDVYSDVRTQLFALSRFKENTFFSDPFDIPANSEFNGIVGGFLVDKNAESFTVGFFPTKDDPTAKSDVIVVPVNASDITAPSADLLK